MMDSPHMKSISALCAEQVSCPSAEIHAPLKDGLDPVVKAFLTDIVRRLTDDWLSGCASKWGSIIEISKATASRNHLDKSVTVFVREGFSQFSQFLALLRYLFLQGECDRMSRNELSLYIRNSVDNFFGCISRERFSEYIERTGDGSDCTRNSDSHDSSSFHDAVDRCSSSNRITDMDEACEMAKRRAGIV